MATKIILKKSSTAGSAPLTSDLEQGEVALNLADRKLYTKDNSGNVIQVGHPYVSTTAPTSPAEGDLWFDASNDALKAYNGTTWEFVGYQNLTDLEDVSVTNAANGDHLTWNGSAFVNSNFTSDARGVVSVNDAGGDGSLSYNSGSGVITYTGPSPSEVQAHFTAGTNTTYSAGTFDITDATIRGKVSVVDAGGDGSLSYNSANGVITYTGPSATEVRAHFSAGTGVDIVNGVVSIGQEVETTSDVTFNDITTTGTIYGPATMTLDPSGHGDNTGTVVIAGDLRVDGTTTTVNSNEVNIGDSIIVLNSDETGTPSQNGGIEVERGTATNVSFVWNETDDAWDLNNETLQNVTLDGGTY
jgi:adhesin HecA-like repeat protein